MSSVRAAPDGARRPCSHSCSVRTETPSSAENWDCDKPVRSRISEIAHARWAGRPNELRVTTPRFDDPVAQELGLERALRDALLRDRGWLTTAEDRLRVRDSCITVACREEFSPFRAGPPARLVQVEAEEWTGQTVYRVEGQAFDALQDVMQRLVLYPKAVIIAWRAGSSHAPTRAAVLYKALAAAAERRGLTILAQPPAVNP